MLSPEAAPLEEGPISGEVVEDVSSSIHKPVGKRDDHYLWKVVGRGRRKRSRKIERPAAHWQIEEFFASNVAEQWILFASLWVLLMRLSWFLHQLQLVSWVSRAHESASTAAVAMLSARAAAFGLWAMAAMLYMAWMYVSSGPDVADKWLDGYVIELVLSMENIFLYHMILAAFKVPASMSRFALLVVSLCQMVFQMFLFMGIAAFIEDLEILPYLLGAWLIVVGVQTLRDDDAEGFDAAHSEAYKTCRLALGNRLLPRYDSEGGIFVYLNGKLHVTMMGPVILCLLTIMFAMEVDVTLAKIEEIDNHFIAWTSSVLAAFALPELFVVVCELLRRFYLLKPAISILVMFFGILLLFRDTIELSDVAELSVMMGIVVGSIILSPFLGYQPRSGDVYSEDTLEKDAPEFSKKNWMDEEAIFETRNSSDEENSQTLTQEPSPNTTPRGDRDLP